MSKWFYDTSTNTTTTMTHCGSLLEGLRSLILQLWKKQGGHDDFMWFGPPERNTLRPQDELYCYVFFKLALNWHEWTSLKSVAAQSLYSTVPGSYM
jgi:hypothetical protein